jgi:hypothetical protein
MNKPLQAIRDDERDFNTGSYTLYTTYGTGWYEITTDSVLSSYTAIPGDDATGPARNVTSVRLASSSNAMMVVSNSVRAPYIYDYSTSAPWV